MPPTLADRLTHILDAIQQIQTALAQKTPDSFAEDALLRLATERLLEIISEASRRIPDQVKAGDIKINWQRMADLGNLLRHAYHRVDPKILWNIAEHDLPPLKAFVDRVISESGD